MKHRLSSALLFIIITAGFLFISCKDKLADYRVFPDYQTGYKVAGPGTDFNWKDLVLSETGKLGVDDRLWLSAAGDVTGDFEPEVIISHSKGVDILDQTGALLTTLFEPGYIVESILLHDIDQDGKEDILLGKQGSSTVGFSVIDGKSNEILDVSFQESPKARTKLEFIHKNTIYLTSTPFYNIAPKITMAVDLETGESEFVYHSAPLVTGLYMGESGYLAIGNRGMGRERKTIPVPYNGESNKPAVLIIDKELAAQMPPDTSSDSINCEIIYETLGDAVKEGDPDSNPITEVITKLVDIDGDGNEEILSLLVAESAFTRGNIRLELRNSDGELRSSWVGPEEEKGDFIFYFKEDKFQIMLTLSYCGKVIILDETLQPKEEKELSPDIDYHELTLEHYGDINGDGKMDFLFSDADTLIVLDQNLKIQFSYIFPGFIETVHILPESKNMRILVQSGDLYPLVADKNLTEKDQNRQIELARSKQTVKNKTDNKSSDFFNTTEERQKIEPLSFNRNPRDFKPQLETILFPDDYAFVYNRADILGDGEEEILVSLIHRRKVAVLDKSYRLLDYLADPVQINFTGHPIGYLLQPVPDLTGDGKDELVPAHNGPLYTTIISGEGQVLQKHLFSHGYDSHNCVVMGKDGIFHQRMETGYLLYPRGILYYDTASQQYVGYNPSAVQSGYIYNEYYEGNFYYGAFTGSNGAEYTHTDGTLEKDTEYFFHTARDGGFSPERSQKYPESEDNRGKLFPFVLNLKTEGEKTPVETLIFATSRYREYYPGPFELFIHNFETGKRTVLFTGPVNGELISINTALYKGETIYALCFKHAGIWLVDNTLKLIKKINVNSTSTLNKLIADFDGDGNSEFICIKEDRIVIISMSGEELVEIEIPEGVMPRFVTNVEQLEDGTIRIVVSGQQGIYVYTM